MIKAYTVLKIKVGMTKAVIDQLMPNKEIREISNVTGVWDLMLEIQAEEMEALNDLIVEKIDLIDGILETNTFVVLKEYK